MRYAIRSVLSNCGFLSILRIAYSRPALRIAYCALRIAAIFTFILSLIPRVLRIHVRIACIGLLATYWPARPPPPTLTLIAYCILRIAYCVLRIAQPTLTHIAYCVLRTVLRIASGVGARRGGFRLGLQGRLVRVRVLWVG